MNKQAVVHPDDRILFKDGKKWTIKSHKKQGDGCVTNFTVVMSINLKKLGKNKLNKIRTSSEAEYCIGEKWYGLIKKNMGSVYNWNPNS